MRSFYENIEIREDTVYLQLKIEDPEVVEWLYRFDDNEERIKLVKQALKVGVIAMTSAWAGGTTQTIRQALESWRAEVEKVVNETIQKSRDQIISQISERFNHQVANQVLIQIDQAARTAAERIKERVETLEKKIDPNHPESWLSTVNEAMKELKDAFDPAKEGSYLWHVKNTLTSFYERDGKAAKCISETINQVFFSVQAIWDNLSKSIEEIKVRLGGTALQRGLAFEKESVGILLQNTTAVTGDLCEHVGGDNRAGDWLIHVMHGGISNRQKIGTIVIEVKDSKKNKQQVHQELENALKSREADVGIMLFARPDQNPYQISFSTIDENYTKMVCVWDENGINFNFAYQLARLCIFEKHLRATTQADWIDLKQQIKELENEVNRIGEIERAARLSKDHSEKAEELCRELRSQLMKRINKLSEIISHIGR